MASILWYRGKRLQLQRQSGRWLRFDVGGGASGATRGAGRCLQNLQPLSSLSC